MESLHAIIPAAGQSERMGRPKLLLDHQGSTLLEHLIQALRLGGVESLRVVIRPDDPDLLRELAEHDVIIVVNPTPERGMLSSILAGLADIGDPAGNLLISPADLPTLMPATIQQLVTAFEQQRPDLAVPTFEGKRGHPLLISHRLVGELRTLDTDQGLHQILRRGHRLLRIPVTDPGVLRDIDTPADYRSLRADPPA